VNPSQLSSTWRAVALLLALSIVFCSSKDPVSVLLKDLEKAAENRDVTAFEKRLAGDFTGNDQFSRDEALSTLRRYFLAYERITLDITKLKRSKTGNHVSFEVSFAGNVNETFKLQNLIPSTASYHFDLQLVQEKGNWKIQRAYWQNLSGL
jgi:hypothetical protein